MTPPQDVLALPTAERSIQSVLAARWARLLIPSLADTFFLAMLAWLLLGSGAEGMLGLLHDGDAGWHIRTGQYILDHRSIPHQDLYSFSKPGAPWYAWEWGADVLFGWLDRLAGLKAVILLTAVVLAAFAVSLLCRMVWSGVNTFIALIITSLSVGAASIHFLARPHIFTLLFVSLVAWLITSDRERQTNWLWLLVPLTLVWTNLHGGFLAGILLLGLAAAGTAIEGALAQRSWRGLFNHHAMRYALLTACCCVATLVNPYGYKLHVHVYEYLRSDWIKNMIQEFMSPSFRSSEMIQFEIVLLTGLAAVAGLLRGKRIMEALWIVVFAHMALISSRHVPLYATVAAPIVAYEASRWWRDWTRGAGERSIRAACNHIASDAAAGFRRTSIWPFAVIGALIAIGPPIPWPSDFPSKVFPTRLVHEHAAQILESRVLTTDQWGDYLIYTNPQQKVFIDGRSDFYGPEIGNQYIRLVNGGEDWREILHKFDFNLVLLPEETPVVQLLKTQPDWRVEAVEDKRVLLTRTTR